MRKKKNVFHTLSKYSMLIYILFIQKQALKELKTLII